MLSTIKPIILDKAERPDSPKNLTSLGDTLKIKYATKAFSKIAPVIIK